MNLSKRELSKEEILLVLNNIMTIPASICWAVVSAAPSWIDSAFGSTKLTVAANSYMMTSIQSNQLEFLHDASQEADIQSDYQTVRNQIRDMYQLAENAIDKNKWGSLSGLYSALTNLTVCSVSSYDELREFLQSIHGIFQKYNDILTIKVTHPFAEWVVQYLIPFKMRGFQVINVILDYGSDVLNDQWINKENKLLELITLPLYDMMRNVKTENNYGAVASLLFYILKVAGVNYRHWNMYPLIFSFTNDVYVTSTLVSEIESLYDTDTLKIISKFTNDDTVNEIIMKNLKQLIPDTSINRVDAYASDDTLKDLVVFVDMGKAPTFDTTVTKEAMKFNKLLIDRYFPEHSNEEPNFVMTETQVGELKELGLLTALVQCSDGIRYLACANKEYFVLFHYGGDTIYGLSCKVQPDSTRKKIEIGYDTRSMYEVQTPKWM